MAREKSLEGCEPWSPSAPPEAGKPSQPIMSRRRAPGALQVHLLVITLGAILLVLCARGDLWLDEIWSFEWAERAGSPWDILRAFPHDNNHPVNSWWLMAIGTESAPLLCRALAILCGLVSLFLIGRLAAVLAPSSRLIATALAAFSFPLVLYFSEARGYAPAVACSLAAAVILVESRSRPPIFFAILFWLVCAVGMLSHATFLLVLAALAAWKMVRIVDDFKAPLAIPRPASRGATQDGHCDLGRGANRSAAEIRVPAVGRVKPFAPAGGSGVPPLPRRANFWAGTLSAGVAWFLIPGTAAVAYYLAFLRPMQIGGGPEYSLTSVLGHFFGYALGLPVDGPWAWAAIAAGSVLYILGVWFGLRNFRIPHIGWLFALLPVAAATGLIFTRPEVLYFRYFLVFLPFFYVALAALLARLAGMGDRRSEMGDRLARLLGIWSWSGTAIVVVLLAAYGTAQAPRLFDLASLGRGSYREALRLVAVSPFVNKVVTSDHDARNKVLVEFFARRDPLCSGVKYLQLSEAGSGRAGWLIRHSQAPLREQPEQFMHTPTKTYRYVAVFPYAGVSGWHWFLYRAESASIPFMTKLSQGESPSLR